MAVILLFVVIGVVAGIILFVSKGSATKNSKNELEECGQNIVELYNKYNPNDKIGYDSQWNTIIIPRLSLHKPSVETYFNNPMSTSSKWSEEDREIFLRLLETYKSKDTARTKNLLGFSPTKGLPTTPAERQRISDIAASTGMKKPQSAAGAMVKGAVVGKLIGGDGGAVVGAMVAKEKHDSKNK